MFNYFLIFCLSLICNDIVAVEDEQPPYMTIINILEQFMTDKQCAESAKQSIYKQFNELVELQKDKASRIQQILNPYELTTKNLFNDWQNLEKQKTEIVTQNLTNLLNCSAVFRTGKRIAAVPGQVAQSAQQAATATKQATVKAAQATASAAKTGATIVVGVPIAAGIATYQTGKAAINTTVNAATEAKKAVENKINQAEEAIVKKKDSYIDRFMNWLATLKRDSTQPK